MSPENEMCLGMGTGTCQTFDLRRGPGPSPVPLERLLYSAGAVLGEQGDSHAPKSEVWPPHCPNEISVEFNWAYVMKI